MKSTIIIIAIIVIAAAGWYVYAGRQSASQQAPAADLGTYPYTCDNGSEFALSPLEGMQAVQVSADAQGMFTGTATLSQVEGTHYAGAAPDGQSVAVVGDGETVHLTVGSGQTDCHPQPNPDEAPWNWGDPTAATGSQS
jgi:hypothetical protein